MKDRSESEWTSSAEFVGSIDGDVDTARDAPVSGDYDTVDERGLLWSARGVDYRQPDPGVLNVTLRVAADGVDLGSYEVYRTTRSSGIVREVVAEQGFYGDYYRREGKTNLPAVVFLGGSEGGDSAWAHASCLAGRGFAVLAIAYRRMPGLPTKQKRSPLELITRGIEWLRARDETTDRVGVVGISAGGTAALLTIGRAEGVSAVVAYSSPGVAVPLRLVSRVPPWTFGGEDLPFVRITLGQMLRLLLGPSGGQAAALSSALSGRHSAVPWIASGTSVPVLLFAGTDDELIGVDTTRAYAQHLKDAGTPVELREFEGAGHLGRLPGLPAAPITVATSGVVKRRFGGTAAANGRAATESWLKLYAFLVEHVGQPVTP